MIPMFLRGSAVVLAVAMAAGCASSVKLDDKPPVETRTPTDGTGSSGGAQSQVATVDLTQGAGGGAGSAAMRATANLPKVIYFDYDSYVVKDEYRVVVDGYAKAMVADRSARLAVEGHTDERGGREYNLALGQRRAEAVVRSLALLGVTENQVEAVSFGKERPAVPGADEASWAKNRRAELAYR